MDNTKRNVHNSGPLGMLVKSGQVKKIEYTEDPIDVSSKGNHLGGSYFKTQSGLEFADHELLYLDPKECESWEFSNRQDDELGDMNELIESIKINKQLQPALIRKHPNPHDQVQYEIIFGRRRHLACLTLGIPFLVIRKDIPNLHDAVALQDAENKFRKDVSPYSNAVLYQRLLKKGIFKTEKQLAEKLRLSTSTLNDLMSFTKIPAEIVSAIPNIHLLSKNFSLKIVSLVNRSDQHYQKVCDLAPFIGKTITSPIQLDKLVQNELTKKHAPKVVTSEIARQYKTHTGYKLFTFKLDHRGAPCFVIHRDLREHLQLSDLCESFQEILEQQLKMSGYPD